jgi:imidazolonepropionase-like amidohydrolase
MLTRSLSSVMLSLAVIAVLNVTPAATESGQDLAVIHARLLDGTGGPVISEGTVLIRGSRIEYAGAAANHPVPAGYHVVDAMGKTVMPGLADMHVHLVGGWDGSSVDMLGYRRYLNSLLYSGVTTVLDTGNVGPFILQMRAETAAGRLPGPRIYCVGPLLDGPDPVWPEISLPIVSSTQIPKVISRLKSNNVDLVKLYVGLSDPEIAAISAEAKKKGLRTIVDQWKRNGSTDIMQEGISGFAHLPWFTLSPPALQLAKDKNIFFISTLIVVESFSRRRFSQLKFLEDPLIANTTPPSFLDALRAEATRSLNDKEKAAAEESGSRLKNAESNARALFQNGTLLIAGTDSAYPGDFQGEGLHHELELLVEAGLTPSQAISVATANAARLMHAESEWGTLQAGRTADLLIVDGRPDQTISDTRKIETVIQRGIILDRNSLRLQPNVDPGYKPLAPLLSPDAVDPFLSN